MESISYASLNFSIVDDMGSFYKEKLPEIPKIRSLINAIKILYSLPTNRVTLEVSEGSRVYRISMLSPDTKKILLGQFVYLPQSNRLDAYSSDQSYPILQWKKKSLVFNNLPAILERAGVDKIFSKIVNVL